MTDKKKLNVQEEGNKIFAHLFPLALGKWVTPRTCTLNQVRVHTSFILLTLNVIFSLIFKNIEEFSW